MTVTDAPGTHRRCRCASATATTEPVDVNKIVRAVDRVSADLADVDPMRVATRTISGLYDGATTAELDRLSIQTAAEMIGEEPQYSRLAARLLSGYIDKEVRNQGVMSFSQSVALGHAEGLIGDETARFVKDNARKLDFAIDPDADRRFEYFGLRTVYDRYLLRHPLEPAGGRDPAVLPAPGRLRAGADPRRGDRVLPADVVAGLPAEQRRRCSTPAPGTPRCRRATSWTARATTSTRSTRATRQVAKLSKFAGGIGIAFSRVRSRGALIRGTNGHPTASCRSCAPSTRRSPPSTRAVGARAPPASTSSRGTPTSRSSSSCATTPARTPGAPTTSTSPTGSPTSSCAASRPTPTGR